VDRSRRLWAGKLRRRSRQGAALRSQRAAIAQGERAAGWTVITTQIVMNVVDPGPRRQPMGCLSVIDDSLFMRVSRLAWELDLRAVEVSDESGSTVVVARVSLIRSRPRLTWPCHRRQRIRSQWFRRGARRPGDHPPRHSASAEWPERRAEPFFLICENSRFPRDSLCV
jgi:hypothetical protein